MGAIQEAIKNSRKIVLKIGSNVLSNDEGAVDKDSMFNIVEQAKELIEAGKQVIIVSSGAGICGVGAINKWSRMGDINYKQALCAIGQVELMMAYSEYFGNYGMHVGQLLLTRDDFGDSLRTLNIRNTLFTLIDEGVVPVINENDSVSVEEIKIGDNDTLSALTANLWNADTLIVLSDIDGVFDCDPKAHFDAELIEEIYDIDGIVSEIDMSGKSSFGTGGISTKIEAARRVNEYGANLVLLNGRKRDIIKKALRGEERGTVFFGKQRRML
ncbi:MAG: glutamate 5-kinase [Clostridiales bacterium]|nr:glutamate 5-kinase [Clostridiales bacterium]